MKAGEGRKKKVREGKENKESQGKLRNRQANKGKWEARGGEMRVDVAERGEWRDVKPGKGRSGKVRKGQIR